MKLDKIENFLMRTGYFFMNSFFEKVSLVKEWVRGQEKTVTWIYKIWSYETHSILFT